MHYAVFQAVRPEFECGGGLAVADPAGERRGQRAATIPRRLSRPPPGVHRAAILRGTTN